MPFFQKYASTIFYAEMKVDFDWLKGCFHKHPQYAIEMQKFDGTQQQLVSNSRL